MVLYIHPGAVRDIDVVFWKHPRYNESIGNVMMLFGIVNSLDSLFPLDVIVRGVSHLHKNKKGTAVNGRALKNFY